MSALYSGAFPYIAGMFRRDVIAPRIASFLLLSLSLSLSLTHSHLSLHISFSIASILHDD